jgi:mannose/fructose/N-acetylgalactosamine-specific phosphotransferase system component IIC
MGESVFRISLSIGLIFLIFSLVALAFVKMDAPEIVPAVLSVAFNLVTVIGSWLVLRYLASKRKKNQ